MNEATLLDLKLLTEKILLYANPETLIFKVPNRFGNIELKYYTYITFFINHLISEKNNNTCDDNIIIENNSNDFTSSPDEQVYFNWNSMKKGEMKNVNLTEFYKRKEELDNYLNINNLNANKININISSKISEN